jgi:hypothetical protein
MTPTQFCQLKLRLKRRPGQIPGRGCGDARPADRRRRSSGAGRGRDQRLPQARADRSFPVHRPPPRRFLDRCAPARVDSSGGCPSRVALRPIPRSPGCYEYVGLDKDHA